MDNNILKNYIKQIILLEQKSNKYNIFIDVLKNSNKSDLLNNINETEIQNKLSNLKKYQFEWLLNYIQSDIKEAEGLSEIIQIAIDFDKYKNTLENKELSSYKTVNEIRKELEKPSKRQIKKNKRLDLQGEYEIVYEDEKNIIYFPHSERASCEIANRMGFGGVTWCTAAEKSDNYFEYYSLDKKVNLYYILSNVDTQSDMNKISIGISDNKINYFGGTTVNSSNENLIKNDLENYFGKEYWIKIENILINFNKKYEKKQHPTVNYLKGEKYIAKYSKDKSQQLKLAKDKSSTIKEYLAGNPNLSKEAQLILSRDPSGTIRGHLAFARNLDKEIQLILSRDEIVYVREQLSSNLGLTKEVQLILARDEAFEVILTLAENPNLSKEVQMILAKNEGKYIGGKLLKNPFLDPEVRKILENE